MGGPQDDVPLVGRERELSALREALARAADGRAGAVVVAGEAGAGKSRLVRQLLAGVALERTRVLRAQCVDLGDPGLPYLVLLDAVRGVRALSTADPAVATLLERHPLAAGIASVAPVGGPADASGPLRLFDATAALLGELGEVGTPGPVLLVVEDLQWVDASSAAFLRFLLSRMGAERLLVVATARTDGLAARPRVRQLLSELARLPTVHRLDLGPLTGPEVAALLEHLRQGPAEPALVADVAARSGGNPSFVRTLAAGVTGAAPDGTLPRTLPRALSDLLVGRLDGLPEGTRALVRAAAVAGRVVPDRVLREVAREVAGLDDAAVDAGLRVAVAEGLLTAGERGYAFAHDLLRSAVYDDLLPAERARLHAACGTAIASRAPAAELAHHWTRTDDTARALVWSVRAADEARRVLAAPEELAHLESALSAWPGVADAASLTGITEGDLTVRAARAAGLAGETAATIEWAERAVRLCDAEGDAAGGVRARVELARGLVTLDATDRVVRPAEEALRLAESTGVDPPTSAAARVAYARALLAARRTAQARPEAQRALEQARAARVAALEVEALTTLAFLDDVDGDLDGAADGLRAALLLARTEGELLAELRVHYTLASLHYYNGDVAGSLPVLDAALSRVAETGLLWSEWGVELRVLQAVARYAAGDLEGSLEAALAPGTRPPDVAAARLAAVACYAAVALGRSDAEQRLRALDDSWDADPQVGLVAGGCEADRLLWERDPVAAAAMAERAQQHLDAAAGPGMYGGLWLCALGLAALADSAATGRRQRDDAAVAEAVRRGDLLLERVEHVVATGRGRPGRLGPEGLAWQARAVAEHARLHGRPGVAEWQAALDAFGYGHAYEQARCHWRLAEALVATGDRGAARAHAAEAATAAERMHAAPLRSAVAATVAGARLSATADAGGTVLTTREREVLALVAEGLTNREVGRRLFISEKTVSVHLSNLMAKLNVSSRTEAVTVAVRRGLHDVSGASPSA